jgi:hypothetical protein
LPFNKLLSSGFKPREVIAWVKKPSTEPEHVLKVLSLASAQPKRAVPSSEIAGEQPPRDGVAGGAGKEAHELSTAQNSMLSTALSTNSTALSTNSLPQGLSYAKLEAMPPEELTSLGLVRRQDGIYRYSRAENGTINLARTCIIVYNKNAHALV